MKVSDYSKKFWDVVIIGAGLGGGVAGRRLSENGLSVLFLEAGTSGFRSEQQKLDALVSDPEARRIRGYWPTKMDATVDGKNTRFFAPVGSGIGGSSVFYAGALERPNRDDIEDLPGSAHPSGGWPIPYDDFLPYYDQAEELFCLSGTADPLSKEVAPKLAAPKELSDGERALFESFEKCGLNPYRLHLAMRNLDRCKNCVGTKCPLDCKMDGRSAGVEPALATENAHFITGCNVQKLLVENRSVTGVKAIVDQSEIEFTAAVVVLAAGALNSPRVLSRSRSAGTDALANSSGWVGRGLMFHANEMFAIWPQKKDRFDGASKSISLRDLYRNGADRYGTVQSLGFEATFGTILQFLKDSYDRSVLHRFSKIKVFLALPAALAVRLFGNAKIFVGILEDYPVFENRVVLDHHASDPIAVEYNIPNDLKRRRKSFRRSIKKAFKKHRTFFLSRNLELNFGHSCGTLRFGKDPKTSVLNQNCRTHDVDNLYVTDSSFMPSSMGVNPSLTIAANALRVADVITTEIRNQKKA